jgi:hypothetical protein
MSLRAQCLRIGLGQNGIAGFCICGGLGRHPRRGGLAAKSGWRLDGKILLLLAMT